MIEGVLHRVISIQSARPEHLPEIAALAAVVWRAHYPGIISNEQIDFMLAQRYDVDVMRAEIGEGTVYERLLVNGKLAGFASHGPTADYSELKLHKLYVHPDRQRQGLGTLLLHHVEALARQRAFRHLVLTVNKRNHQAIAAYLKNGFAVRESVVVDIGRGFVMDDYVMAKAL